MRKMMLVLFVVLLAVGFVAAQTYTQGTGLTGIDVLGAHNNGGRGCAGCHAPHSGAAGGGGNAVTGGKFTDTQSGSNALFGQDVSPLFGQTLTFSGYVEILPGQAAAYSTNEEELRGIMMCLACHDGQIAKGQMMAGVSWEKANNLLPAGVYGPNGIPTLLGNDNGNGNTSGYGNDHPVGTAATLGALRLVSSPAKATDPLTVTMNAAGTGIQHHRSDVPDRPMRQFAVNYGYPSIAGTAWSYGFAMPEGGTDPSKAFMTCTTCHNQHVMYVYKAPSGKQGGTEDRRRNLSDLLLYQRSLQPGAGNTNPTMAASTTQFCRQCHTGEQNEALGVNTVQTQF